MGLSISSIAMDSRQSHESEGSRQHDPAGTPTLKPVSLPEDVLRMIFTESLSKPAIHFASAVMRIVPGQKFENRDVFAVHLTPWGNGTLESGYVATQKLAQVCKVSRDVVRRSTLEPAFIRYDTGTVSIDAATDILCCVVQRHWNRQQNSRFYDLGGLQAQEDGAEWTKKLRDIRRTGVLVDKDMWHEVLRCWFIPESGNGHVQYNRIDGRLGFDSLFTIMGDCDLRRMDFYLILPDISVDEWNSYYNKFPVVFHDHNGSYVEASEVPVHSQVINELWSYPWRADPEIYQIYPYCNRDSMHLNLDPDFESRLDALLHPQERVALLLGLVNNFV